MCAADGVAVEVSTWVIRSSRTSCSVVFVIFFPKPEGMPQACGPEQTRGSLRPYDINVTDRTPYTAQSLRSIWNEEIKL